jgi:16S rRNA (cytidine1402-2'-O)-methyltransferase
MKNLNIVYLIPNELAENTWEQVMPREVSDVLKSLQWIFCEDERTTRRYISKMMKGLRPVESYHLLPLTKDTQPQELSELLKEIPEEITSIGVISDAGCPGIADPGALVVAWAHQNNVRVHPLVGPSSILLCLIASGLSGQSFSFNGYLPIDPVERKKKIKNLEQWSIQNYQTQLFMETPYRNDKLIDDLVSFLQPSTRLTIASYITHPTEERIVTKSISEWKKAPFKPGKQPVMFALMGDK